MRLSGWDDQLLSAAKEITFQTKPTPKLHKPATSTGTPYLLYIYLLISLKFTVLFVSKEIF